ncbi:ADP-heptose:LPS heptosyltransferase [Tenacibaculum sp. 190524A02b]
MGDVAMTVPVIRAFIAKNNNVKITVLTRAFFAPFFSEFDNVEVFIPDLKGKHKGILGLVKLHKELMELGVDCVADLHNVLRSNVLVTLFKLRGIPCVQLDKGRNEKKQLIVKKSNKILKPLKSMHVRYSDVFSKLGFTIDIETIVDVKKTEIPSFIKERIATKKIIGLAPFAAYESKSLPIDKLQELIKNLANIDEVTILLIGGGNKEKVILDGLANNYDNIISIVGKGSFKEELDLISNLNVMIAMDSGNGHIAAMYNVPVITIWGVTHPYLGFTPYNQPKENQILPDLQKYPLIPTSVYGKDYPDGYLECFNTIDVQTIVSRVKKYI